MVFFKEKYDIDISKNLARGCNFNIKVSGGCNFNIKVSGGCSFNIINLQDAHVTVLKGELRNRDNLEIVYVDPDFLFRKNINSTKFRKYYNFVAKFIVFTQRTYFLHENYKTVE